MIIQSTIDNPEELLAIVGEQEFPPNKEWKYYHEYEEGRWAGTQGFKAGKQVITYQEFKAKFMKVEIHEF